MGAIAGMWSRTRSPIDRQSLAGVAGALSKTAPASAIAATNSELAMLVCQRSDELSNSEPARSAFGDCLTLEGRIDNLSEIQKHSGYPSGSNAEVLLALYRRSGITAFANIVGEFALAIWDARLQELILCVDPIGRHALYYHLTPQTAYWSTRSRTVLAMAGLAPRPNREYVADYFMNTAPVVGPYDRVGLVRGGYAVRIGSSHNRSVRYWQPDPTKKIEYRSDSEYEEHFRYLFREAVECRMPAAGDVFCELSGGVDSSTIAVTAAAILRESDPKQASRRLRTVSYLFDNSHTADERGYVELVERQLGGTGLHLSDADHPILRPVPASLTPDVPTNDLAFLSRHDRVSVEMEQTQTSILLSGIGGDQLFASSPSPLLATVDKISSGAYREWLSDCRRVAELSRKPLIPLLTAGLRAQFKKHDATFDNPKRGEIVDWLEPTFVRDTNLLEREYIANDIGFRVPTMAALYASIQRTMRAFALERVVSGWHIDSQYPYLDKRIVEFSFAIPYSQKVRLSVPESRSIVRRAFRGLLPDQVRRRQTKSGPSEAIMKAVTREQGRLLAASRSDLRAADLGFVAADRLHDGIRLIAHGRIAQAGQVVPTFALEDWLQSLELCSSELSSRRSVVNRPLAERPFSEGASHEEAAVRNARVARAGYH